jgi:hypothetical protein
MPDDTEVRLTLKYALAPENAALFAADLVAVAHSVDGIILDYSVDSVSKVDGLLEAFRTEHLGPHQVGETVISVGFYLGEVLVRNANAVWRSPVGTALEASATFPAILFWPGSDRLADPLGRAFARLADGAGEDLGTFYANFA